jgi:hypothetical protein
MSRTNNVPSNLDSAEVSLNEDFVSMEDLTTKPGDFTKQARWARNLSVVPMDLEDILKSILNSEKN